MHSPNGMPLSTCAVTKMRACTCRHAPRRIRAMLDRRHQPNCGHSNLRAANLTGLRENLRCHRRRRKMPGRIEVAITKDRERG